MGRKMNEIELSIVVPCYKSEGTLEQLSSLVLADPFLTRHPFELILVVDGSPDNTGRVVQAIAETDQRVRAIQLSRNFGQHNALIAGISQARGSIIITMDDDLQHKPSEIEKLVGPLLADEVSVVYGIPLQEEHGYIRSLFSRIVKRLIALGGFPNATKISAFRGFKTSTLPDIGAVNDPNVQLDVLLGWATDSIASVQVEMDYRSAGKSNYSYAALFHYAMNLITGYSSKPLRFVTALGFVSTGVALVLAVVLVAEYAMTTNSPTGFTSTVCIIAFFAGAQMLSLGLLGEYLARMHDRNSGKPTFRIKG